MRRRDSKRKESLARKSTTATTSLWYPTFILVSPSTDGSFKSQQSCKGLKIISFGIFSSKNGKRSSVPEQSQSKIYYSRVKRALRGQVRKLKTLFKFDWNLVTKKKADAAKLSQQRQTCIVLLTRDKHRHHRINLLRRFFGLTKYHSTRGCTPTQLSQHVPRKIETYVYSQSEEDNGGALQSTIDCGYDGKIPQSLGSCTCSPKHPLILRQESRNPLRHWVLHHALALQPPPLNLPSKDNILNANDIVAPKGEEFPLPTIPKTIALQCTHK